MEENQTNNQRFEPKHTSYGWGIIAFIILSLVVGFVGGALAVRLYDQQLSDTATPEAQQKIVSSESEVISKVAAEVGPSVVSINVESQTSGGFWFDRPLTQSSAGTGIIVSADGLVLTNRHVISSGNTVSLQIVLSDGTVYDEVEVVDRDDFNDLAFLQIKGAKDLPVAKLGDSDKMQVGNLVIAIGNALGRFDNTVTTGIISGTARPIVAGDGTSSESLQNLFQTDAAINPGNSGGPLVNINGEVIGVNTAVAGGAENIGFAIPINDVKSVLASVLDSGKIVRPYLGVRYVTLSPSIAEQLEVEATEGALISSGGGQAAVLSGSPADKAGLKDGDILVQINEHKITAEQPLVSLVNRFKVGDKIIITFIRNGERQTTELTLESAPDNP